MHTPLLHLKLPGLHAEFQCQIADEINGKPKESIPGSFYGFIEERSFSQFWIWLAMKQSKKTGS